MRDADDLFMRMHSDVLEFGTVRTTTDPESPMRERTMEAALFNRYYMDDPTSNLVSVRRVDGRWATANVLHFFAATEEAEVLRKYNGRADKFLSCGKLVGAYGPIAVPQLRRCAKLLQESPFTRRAIVSMGELGERTVNSPPCWSHLHLLYSTGRLHMHVYQRSLNLHGVMPYDCVLLTNVLMYAAAMAKLPVGSMTWTIGSLHFPEDHRALGAREELRGIVLPPLLLDDPSACYECLAKEELP